MKNRDLKVTFFSWLRHQMSSLSSDFHQYLTHESAFSRAKRLSFDRCIAFMLNSPRRSLGVELVDFFSSVNSFKDLCTVSAWVQARKQILPQVFKDLNDRLCESAESWEGLEQRSDDAFSEFRLFGVDGSTLYLPQTPALAQHFGVQPNAHKGIAMARIVVCHHLTSNLCYRSYLGRIDQGEEVPLPGWIEKSGPKDLMIYDRGFPSYLLFWLHQQADSNVVARMPRTFEIVNSFIESGQEEALYLLEPPKSLKQAARKAQIELPQSPPPITLRLLRIELSSGETEVLATSLIDQEKYPHQAFKQLYFKRWQVETFFDIFKNKLNLELFTGHLPIVIEQDFFASIFLANLHQIITHIAQKQIKTSQNNTYQYQINKNVALGIIKNRLPAILFNIKSEEHIKILLDTIARFTQPIRPHRTFERTRRAKKYKGRWQYQLNYKRAV